MRRGKGLIAVSELALSFPFVALPFAFVVLLSLSFASALVVAFALETKRSFWTAAFVVFWPLIFN